MERLNLRNITLTEYEHKIAASTSIFHAVRESSGGSLPIVPLHEPDPLTLDILFLPKRPTTRWRVCMGADDHVLFEGSPASLPFEYAIK
ncbi:hypothetical protein EVAR_5804_1 [Eumeta japonica]|uniref:Uncharacterized protein n=1 Tax=Eumeta variegata TaxID=151549 RepID=A0A4C1T4E3_EUMVA|nr:hypothetical protein EVAR_5804_1 [Eumeta japonica]